MFLQYVPTFPFIVFSLPFLGNMFPKELGSAEGRLTPTTEPFGWADRAGPPAPQKVLLVKMASHPGVTSF